jgi:hypothetical protein
VEGIQTKLKNVAGVDSVLLVPDRVAVAFIHNCDQNILKQFSPETAAFKPWTKLTLFLICVVSGAISGFSIAIIKCSTELLKHEGQVSWL